ncbi:MAG: guanylate kinase [Desulfobulbaceae bacterium]|nr:guanylate kinase [Desulfobulbaceae bacterium]HIJ78008.1 guanylate kinase [Deltaproteobacteria bacterium]
MSKGNLFVISAPSGTGKTTILKKILTAVPGVAFSVSHTTRAPRTGEQDGIDYFFISREEFIAMRDDNAFLEWAEVHGNMYGTSRRAVEDKLAAGIDIFLDIDVQGAKQLKKLTDLEAIFLFIAPPSWEELEKRLSGRGTDSSETVRLRLNNARTEMTETELYDYLVINDVIDEAVDMIRSVIMAERCRKRRSLHGAPISPALLSPSA